MQTNRYGFLRRLVHWALALVTLGLLAVGILFYFFSFDALQAKFGADTTSSLYLYHKSFGIVALILALLVLYLRSHGGVPAYDPPLALLLRWPSKLVHWLIILALVAQPVVGLVGTILGGHPVQFFGWTLPKLLSENKALSDQVFGYHAFLGWTLLVLVLIHLGGAYVHGAIARDNVNSRMGLF